VRENFQIHLIGFRDELREEARHSCLAKHYGLGPLWTCNGASSKITGCRSIPQVLSTDHSSDGLTEECDAAIVIGLLSAIPASMACGTGLRPQDHPPVWFEGRSRVKGSPPSQRANGM
jgi:hypothetical protein